MDSAAIWVRVMHHVFLPPRLPQEADEDSEIVLVKATLQGLLALRGLLQPDSTPKALGNAISLLENIRTINSSPGGTIDETRLCEILTSLPIGLTLAANVRSQNAAVLITRRPEGLVFEEFELSPRDEAVIKAEGRLIRTFPGLAIKVPAKVLDEPSFPEVIASTLSTMCHQQVPGMQPQSLKNGVKHVEERDTIDPAMVSELLMGVLAGVGSPIAVSAISKNTRDEVLWKQTSAPWRRSPMWLLVRVALQLVISRSSDGSHDLYKGVMVFVMSQLLEKARVVRLSSDTLYSMTAKIQRRLCKLSGAGQASLPKAVMTSINQNLHEALVELAKRWNACQQADKRDLQLHTLSTLNFEQDTLVSLPLLDKYIETTRKRRRGSTHVFFTPSSELIKLSPGTLPSLPTCQYKDPYYAIANLHQLEQWVVRHVDGWVATAAQGDACEMLRDLMGQYYNHARGCYCGNPEAMSVMVLTTFELWVACDKAALRECPWLSEYDPGIPTDALQNLLLPFSSQMKRLSQLESHIDSRRVTSIRETDLLFSSNNSDTFASKYFDQSETHLALKRRIVADADAARQAKLDEFKKVKAQYHRLDRLCNGTEHEYTVEIVDDWCDPPETQEEHSRKCQKCAYMSQLKGLRIQVHEWPLPKNPSEAKAVVFELRIPSWFGHWRDARLILLKDVLKGERTKVKPSTKYLLSSHDPHLSHRYFQRSTQGRIDLLSQTKPTLSSHYSNKTIAILDESQVCVPSGLKYQYYDATSDEYPGNFEFKDVVPEACTYEMPCQALQTFLVRRASVPDGPGPNVVIASQNACPENMTLEEYKEFGTLSLGRHIQWANILLQLAMPTVDFKKSETSLLFLQCIYQAGPSSHPRFVDPGGFNESNTLRDSHRFFSREENAHALLQHLTEALQRVKNNWESSQALFVFVAIAARALSLSAFAQVHKACLVFLTTARNIALEWVISLRDKAHTAADHKDRADFIAKSVEVALICTSTFDLDDQYLANVVAEDRDASVLVQMSIIVQEGEHSHKSEQEPHISLLVLRRKRLLLRIYKILAQHTTALDDAIQKNWSAYTPGSGWRPASDATDHWVQTDMLATTQNASMIVHYNLLSGELLVNGLPLGQPPPLYCTHPLYSALFGKATVEVMPSTTPGYQFSAKRKFRGFDVQLGMSSNELIVRATKGNTTYETIPSRLFGTAYPFSFTHDYVHWFNDSTDTLQFRPVNKPWTAASPAIWTLSRVQTRWRLTNAEQSVVGTGSSTSRRLSHVLDPLADPPRIHNLLQSSGNMSTLHVNIPTLGLGFSLAQESNVLTSKEFRSMAVDADQSLGTLIGLNSKIVLKHITRHDRMALLPESSVVSYQDNDDHTSVTVAKSSIHRVHAVRLDPTLGRLIDDTELSSKLFLAYLHALTSFCLIDPLTHRTGTEQALTILRSAAVRSFDQLLQEHVDMLTKLAALSPGRCYYPAHKRVMQTVHWDPNIRSFLSQDGQFVTIVKSLLQQAEKALIFAPDAQLSFPRQERIDQHLLQRDNIRSATFRVSGFGAESHTTLKDEIYTARDRDSRSQRAVRASAMSCFIFRGGVGCFQSALARGSLWRKMCAYDTVHGPQLPIKLEDLKYDASLLKDEPFSIVQRLPALHRSLAAAASERHKFSIIVWLSTLAFHEKADVSLLQSVALLFKSPVLAQVSVPQRSSFRPKSGHICSKSALLEVARKHTRPLDSCPEQNLVRLKNEKLNEYHSRRYEAWRSACDIALDVLVGRLAAQWPCNTPNAPDVPSTYIVVDEAMPEVKSLFQTWHDNSLLHEYLTSIEQNVLNLDFEGIQTLDLTVGAPPTRLQIFGFESERSIFMIPAPELPEGCQTLHHTLGSSTPRHRDGDPPFLESVIQDLEGLTSRSKYETRYVADLRESLDALVLRDDSLPQSVSLTEIALSSYLKSCAEHVVELYGILKGAVTSPSSSGGTRFGYQLPRVSPTFFLHQLSRHRWQLLSEEWKACIVRYAIALTEKQRAERLMRLSEKEDIINELLNSGHQNWNPMQYPETLLMEVECNFLVRDVQAQVAAQMESPPDDNNAVMQLNMGEGKSSVIVPIVAAALADGEQLLRVVVAKPQSKQMAQMLISKLGGLLDRRVYYMPVSRSLKLDPKAALTIQEMLSDCMSSGGILLIQPEHILSFQLMIPESYISGRRDVGQQLMSTQDFFDQKARDIVDESDENFSVRFELIYTMGTQRPIELSPDRWFVFQQVLELVKRLAPGVAQDLPLSLDYHPGVPGSFPRIRIFRPDAGTLLQQRLAHHICNNGLDQLQVSRQPEEIRKAVYSYVTKANLNAAEIAAVESSSFWTERTQTTILLIRGILACGVLDFALGQKRWRVNYGLATRIPPTRLAVPYRAKDSPSPRSEFNHPDVIIALTSLSYYYGGLSDEDLFTAMGCLMESDQSDAEYQAWVQDAHDLSAAFKQLQGINLKDRPLCTSELFPALRFAKSVIDFFLSHIVFPKQMKEFPHKLSASGWDIGKRKCRPVAGFSGTNDSRCLLPTDVHHLDHPDQKHTNALVLEYILQPDNGVALLEPVMSNTSDAEHLLTAVLNLAPPVQVILDVGAQILELNNIEVAKAWLKKHGTTKEAAVFVNDEDELCVVDREHKVDLLRTSSYLARLDSCLIFLDEAHTRGIDLKLPSYYRAAVTLGAGLSKDRLVQACMRLRKLGKGQTVVFCISQEIQAKITRQTTKARKSDITVSDVILLAIGETQVDIRRSMPLWAVQGERFVRQEKLWQQIRQNGKTLLSEDYAKKFQEAEAQSLDDRCRPRQIQIQPLFMSGAPHLQTGLERIAERCRQFDDLNFNSSTLQEEQERELSPETEQERQVQRAPDAAPATHSLHEDIRNFAIDGVFTSDSVAYMPAFEALKDSSAARNFSVQQLAGESRLLVSADFAKTIVPSSSSSYLSDAFQRPAQWLLMSRGGPPSRIIIISPYEANQLYRRMQHSTAASLHIYKPRCNSGYAPLDRLDLHTISAQSGPGLVPRGLTVQLNLFAGQLYISSYADYKEICNFLGLSPEALTEEMAKQGWKVAADGFILSDEQGFPGGRSGLRQSPVNFLKILMSKIRRNGDGIAKTHMGQLLEGKIFQKSEFEGTSELRRNGRDLFPRSTQDMALPKVCIIF